MNARNSDIPVWEWVLAGLGTAILLGAILFFAVQSVSPPGVPRFTVRADTVLATESAYTVIIEVRNGGRSAANVTVEGELTRPDRMRETAEVTFSSLAARSQKKAALVFETDPRTTRLRIRVRSFSDQ